MQIRLARRRPARLRLVCGRTCSLASRGARAGEEEAARVEQLAQNEREKLAAMLKAQEEKAAAAAAAAESELKTLAEALQKAKSAAIAAIGNL